VLNEASRYGYSVADVDYESVVHNNQNFRNFSVPKTNDASLFRDPAFVNLTTRNQMRGSGDHGFYYRNQANEILREGVNDITKMYHISKDLNHEGKVFYSSCLNAKGGSQVSINDKSAGLPSNKI
jgi:hypothetical protein